MIRPTHIRAALRWLATGDNAFYPFTFILVPPLLAITMMGFS